MTGTYMFESKYCNTISALVVSRDFASSNIISFHAAFELYRFRKTRMPFELFSIFCVFAWKTKNLTKPMNIIEKHYEKEKLKKLCFGEFHFFVRNL